MTVDTPAKLRAARKRLGLTQDQLAAEIGYSIRMIKYMESGEKEISVKAAKLVQGLIRANYIKPNRISVQAIESSANS